MLATNAAIFLAKLHDAFNNVGLVSAIREKNILLIHVLPFFLYIACYDLLWAMRLTKKSGIIVCRALGYMRTHEFVKEKNKCDLLIAYEC